MDTDSKVKANVTLRDAVISDNPTSCTYFKSIVKKHHARVTPKGLIGKMIPRGHIATSNAKHSLPDIFHDIAPEYHQDYPNEFCRKFNRRYFGDTLFDRLVVAGVPYKNELKYHID